MKPKKSEKGRRPKSRSRRAELRKKKTRLKEKKKRIKTKKRKKEGENKEKESGKIEKAEKKEALTEEQKIKVAEILCLADDKTKKEEYPKIIAELEKKYSREAIDKAWEVAGARLRTDEIYARVLEAQRTTHKNKSVVDICKEFQREGRNDYDLLFARNVHRQALIGLKAQLFRDETKTLEKEFGKGDFRVMEKLYDAKGENYEKWAFDLMVTEIRRMNGSVERTASALERKEKSVSQRVLEKISKIPRPLRIILGSALVGGTVAAFTPAFALSALPGYLGYRVLRSLSGATVSAGLQKLIGNRIADKVYTKKLRDGFRPIYDAAHNEIENDPEIRSLIESRGFNKLSERNYEKAKDVAEKLDAVEKDAEKKKKRTQIATMLGTGILGGVAGAAAFDMLVGPHADAIFGSGKPSADTIPERKGGGAAPAPETPGEVSPEPTPEISPETMKAATIGQGEGVEHAFRRQLELDPQKFGFKGDITDKGAIRAWSGGEAHRIAIDQGYVDKVTGEEIRVLDVGPKGAAGNPAYVLEQGSGGKPSVQEFLDGKPSGGEGMKSAYEYLYEKPKVADVPVEGKGSADALYEERLRTASEPIKSGFEETLAKGKINVPDHLEVPPSVERVNIFSDFEKAVPQMEEMTEKFPKLTLSEQEQYLMSSEIEKIDNQVRYLQEHNFIPAPGSGREADLLGDIRDHYAEMLDTYQQNDAKFVAAVKGAVQLNNAGFEKFVNTPIKEIWNIPNGPRFDKVSDLMKSVNVTSADLGSGKTVGEILRGKFLDGEFIRVEK